MTKLLTAALFVLSASPALAGAPAWQGSWLAEGNEYATVNAKSIDLNGVGGCEITKTTPTKTGAMMLGNCAGDDDDAAAKPTRITIKMDGPDAMTLHVEGFASMHYVRGKDQ
jgi:hypothetical protein